MVSIVAMLFGGYALLVVVVFFAQSALLYFPSHEVFATPHQVGLSYQPVKFKTSDDLTLDGWYVPADPAGAGDTVLFFHGNAGNITHRLDSLLVFNELGLNTFIFDYRGFGQSEGKISEAGSYLDAEAALAYLTDTRGIAPKHIIFFGRSLGGAIAARLASGTPPKMVILESTFTSIPDLAATVYPFLPARWMSRFDYDAETYLKSVHSPVLIVHSRDDEIIPLRHAKALYAAAPGPKAFLEIRGNHNVGFLLDRNAYLKGLQHFIERYR